MQNHSVGDGVANSMSESYNFGLLKVEFIISHLKKRN